MQIKIILLGLVQGLTEFLPVSSSGHLALMQLLCGADEVPLAYDIVLHCATMFATLLFFGYEIITLILEWFGGFRSDAARTKEGWSTGWAVVIATLITAVIGIGTTSVVGTILQNPLCIGIGLVVTGTLLLYACHIKPGYGHIRPSDGIIVGIAQGIATLPGISRSGSTIVAGCIAGLSREDAFRFSFLVSIPAIFGATLLEAFNLGGCTNFFLQLPKGWFIGAVTAFFSGFASLFVLRKIVISAKWWIFGIYCLAIGITTVFITFMGG